MNFIDEMNVKTLEDTFRGGSIREHVNYNVLTYVIIAIGTLVYQKNNFKELNGTYIFLFYVRIVNGSKKAWRHKEEIRIKKEKNQYIWIYFPNYVMLAGNHMNPYMYCMCKLMFRDIFANRFRMYQSMYKDM